jgi:hypothetical protein
MAIAKNRLAVYVERGFQAEAGDCLKSLEWADEIFLGHGVEVVPTNSQLSMQTVETLPQCRSEWLLRVASDERISKALRHEIRKILNSSKVEDCFLVSSRCLFMKKWMRGTFFHQIPETRLVRSGSPCRVIGRVSCPIEQHLPSSLTEMVSILNRFSAEQASKIFQSRDSLGRPNFAARPFAVLTGSLFTQGLWREGYPGLILSLLISFSHLLMRVYVWELERKERESRFPVHP